MIHIIIINIILQWYYCVYSLQCNVYYSVYSIFYSIQYSIQYSEAIKYSIFNVNTISNILFDMMPFYSILPFLYSIILWYSDIILSILNIQWLFNDLVCILMTSFILNPFHSFILMIPHSIFLHSFLTYSNVIYSKYQPNQSR